MWDEWGSSILMARTWRWETNAHFWWIGDFMENVKLSWDCTSLEHVILCPITEPNLNSSGTQFGLILRVVDEWVELLVQSMNHRSFKPAFISPCLRLLSRMSVGSSLVTAVTNLHQNITLLYLICFSPKEKCRNQISAACGNYLLSKQLYHLYVFTAN